MAESAKDELKTMVARNAADLQRIRLEKLMKNPDKPVYIPERPQDKKMKEPPEFVRNVWGSSAGAGSGEFHVYRGIRRREYARQKFLNEKTVKDDADDQYREKVVKNQEAADARTAKKRAKRLKQKAKRNSAEKTKPSGLKENKKKEDSEDESSEEDEKSEKNDEITSDKMEQEK